MSFGTAPGVGIAGGGTVVGQAQYVVTLNEQPMLQALQQLEQTSRQGSQQIVQALQGIAQGEQQVAQQSAQMAQTVQREVSQMETTMRGMAATANQVSGELKTLASTALGLAGFSVITSAFLELNTQLRESITTTRQFATEIVQIQRVTGETVEKISPFVAVLDRYGVGAETANRAFTTLSKAMVGIEDEQDGIQKTGLGAVATLEKLGLTTTNTNGTLKNTTDFFLEVIDKINGMTTASDKAVAANALLGRNYQELLPIIQLGSAGFTKLAEEADKMGVKLTTANIASVKEFTAEGKKMNDALEGLRISIGVVLMPLMSELARSFTAIAKAANEEGRPAIQGFGDDVRALAADVKQGIAEVKGTFDDVFNLLQAEEDLRRRALALRVGVTFEGRFPQLTQQAQDALNGIVPAPGSLPGEEAQAAAHAAALQRQADAQNVASAEEQSGQIAVESNQKIAKSIEDNLKKRGEEVKAEADREIVSLHEQEQAAQRSYDTSLKAYQNFKEERTRANDAWHRDALEKLKVEEDATKASYDAQIRAAEIAKDRRIAANEESHKSTLAQIDVERKAAEEASKGRVVDLEVARNAAFGDVNTVKEQQLTILQAQQEATREARTQQDHDRADARQQEDRDAATAHQVEVDRLKTEHDAAVEGFKDRRAEIERTKQAALEAIQSETDKEAQQHEQALARLQVEQQAAQATHDQAARALEDQGRALQAQHDAALKAIQAEQQAAQDEHDAALRAIQDQQQVAQTAHDQRIQQLRDEQTAEERASQARQTSLKAENDELSHQHTERLSEIDAEAKAQQAALQQQLTALQQQQQGASFAQQQAALQQNVAQAQTGLQIAQEIAANTGDPNTMLAARKALADAQAALDKANADRAVQIQRDAIQQQIADLKDQTDAKKQAEQDQYQAEKDRITAEIANEQKHLQAVKDAIAQQIQAADQQLAALKNAAAQEIQADNDRLTAIRRNLQAQQDAENAQFKQRQDQIAAEKRANDDRLAAELANLAKERDAENERQKQFAANETSKRRAAEQTATAQLANVQGESDTEQKAYALATETVNKRYAAEQQRVTDTRRVQDRAIADNRVAEDRDFATHRQAIEDTAKHDHEQIDTLYNDPKTGLIAIEKNALTETLNDLTARKTAADTTYEDEQKQIKATFDDKETGLIPHLQAALKEQQDKYRDRRTDIDTTYQREKDAIYDTFDNPNPPDGKGGLIPKLQKAYEQTRDRLADQVKEWTAWQTNVSKEIGTAIDNLQKLIDKVQELNKIGQTPIREGPQPVPGQAQGNAPEGQAAFPETTGGYAPVIHNALPNSYITDQGTHTGGPAADIFAPRGSPIFTPVGGTLTAISTPLGGNSAILRGNDGRSYYFAHGNIPFISGKVTKGQQIGEVGNSGAPGVDTHLHFAIADNPNDPFSRGIRGGSGNVWFDKTWWTTGGSATSAGQTTGDAFVAIDVPSLGISFQVPGQPTQPIGPGGRPAPTTADATHWRDFFADFAPGALSQDLRFLKIVTAGALGESGLDPHRVQDGLPRAIAAKGIFQFDPGGMGAGVPESLLFDPAYEASRIIPLYAEAFHRFAGQAGQMSAAEFASLVAATAERPFDYQNPASQARRNYVSAFESLGGLGGGAAFGGSTIPAPAPLVDLRNLRPYGFTAERQPEFVASRASAGEHYNPIHNWYGVTPESVVREMQTQQRRERMLRGRW